MTRLVVLLCTIAIAIVAATWGVGAFLAPDDLKACPQGPDMTNKKCQPADAIIAISGGDTEARTFEAIRLYKAGWAKRLIFSGAALDENSPSNAWAMKQQAIQSGVPAPAISIEELARDTAENASRTRQLAIRNGLRRIILVTSAYHQRRASMEFNRVFADTTIINHPAPRDRQWADAWWLTPIGWWLAAGELLKIIVVAMNGTV